MNLRRWRSPIFFRAIIDLTKRSKWSTNCSSRGLLGQGRTSLGILLEQKGRSADAAVEYETVLTLKPKAPVVSYRLASIYAEQPGKLDVALSLALNAKVQLDTYSAVK